MAPKYVTPAVTLRSFNCPHCGALADQTWFVAWVSRYINNEVPSLVTREKVEGFRRSNSEIPRDVIDFFTREANGDVLITETGRGDYCRNELKNIYVSRCFSCEDVTVWRYDTILYPPVRFEIEPNPDMNDDIRADFDEARAILDQSPRGAAALLRLCIQKLCKQIGQPGEKLNADIAALVKDGLSPRIQQALDVVRVIGNSAVHPGELDLRDDRETASKLFDLVNFIANDRITGPKQVEALFSGLPPGSIAAIEKRDGTKAE